MRREPGDISEWEPARTAPLDGTPVEARFIDEKGEYPGFRIAWDPAAKGWRNWQTGDLVLGTVSRWRPCVGYRDTRRRR